MSGPIARSTVRTTGVLGLRLVVQASTLLLVARLLGPQQFGAFAGVAALAVTLGALSTFGTHLVLLGGVSKDPGLRDHILSYAIPFTLTCAAPLLVIYLAITVLGLSDVDVPVEVLVALGVAEILLQPLFLFPSAVMMAKGNIAQSQMLMLFPQTLRLAAAAAVFWLRPSGAMTWYGYGYLLASATALAVFLMITRPTLPPWNRWHMPTRSQLRSAGGYAALNTTRLGPTELDKTLATRLIPLSDAGLYAVGSRVISATTLPVAAMMFSTLPRLFREGVDQTHRAARLLLWIFGAALSYSIFLAIAVWVAAPWIEWLFGEKFQGIQHMLHWLVLAMPGMALRIAAGQALVGLELPWARVAFEVFGLLMLVVVAILASPLAAGAGMAIALAASEWTMAIFGWLVIVASIRRGGRDQCESA